MPEAVIDRIEAITHDMHDRPEVHLAELETLVAEYPHIAMLRNHLAGALAKAGQSERAEQLTAEMVRLFPRYIFAFCNHVMHLLDDGKVDEARALVETGPRGPRLMLTDFDPSRDTFHVSEANSHAAMVGRYMLATGRVEAARVQLSMIEQTAPESVPAKYLAQAIKRYEGMKPPLDTLNKITTEAERRVLRKKVKAEKDKSSSPSTASGTSWTKKVVNESSTSKKRPMLQLRVWLVDSKPEVWRRPIVDPRLTFEQLHTALQISFFASSSDAAKLVETQ